MELSKVKILKEKDLGGTDHCVQTFSYGPYFTLSLKTGNSVHLYDLRFEIPRCIEKIEEHGKEVNQVIKWDEKNLLSCSDDNKIIGFSIEGARGGEKKLFLMNKSPVYGLLKLDKKFFLSVNKDGELKVIWWLKRRWMKKEYPLHELKLDVDKNVKPVLSKSSEECFFINSKEMVMKIDWKNSKAVKTWNLKGVTDLKSIQNPKGEENVVCVKKGEKAIFLINTQDDSIKEKKLDFHPNSMCIIREKRTNQIVITLGDSEGNIHFLSSNMDELLHLHADDGIVGSLISLDDQVVNQHLAFCGKFRKSRAKHLKISRLTVTQIDSIPLQKKSKPSSESELEEEGEEEEDEGEEEEVTRQEIISPLPTKYDEKQKIPFDVAAPKKRRSPPPRPPKRKKKAVSEEEEVDIMKINMKYWLACFHGRFEDVKKLVTKVDINFRNPFSDPKNVSALSIASEKGHLEIVKFLLIQEGIDVNILNDEGYSPLGMSIAPGHLKIVKTYLRDERVDVNKGSYSPLAISCGEQQVDIAKEILYHPRVDISKNNAIGFCGKNKDLFTMIYRYKNAGKKTYERNKMRMLENEVREVRSHKEEWEKRYLETMERLEAMRFQIFQIDWSDVTILKNPKDGKDIVLGAGGFGKVYEAMWKNKSKVVAVKEIYTTPSSSKEDIIEEFQKQVGFVHPLVVRIFGICLNPSSFRGACI